MPGPPPDRELTGPVGPGAATSLVYCPGALFGPDEANAHWPGVRPSGALIVARLGSMPIGGTSTLIDWRNSGAGRAFYFYAHRISSTEVRLEVGVQGLILSQFGVTVAWKGPTALHTWAYHTNGFTGANGIVLGAGACDAVVTQGHDASGSINYTNAELADVAATVPADGPADKALMYAAVWWDPPSPASPTTAEFTLLMRGLACPGRWRIDRIGWRRT